MREKEVRNKLRPNRLEWLASQLGKQGRKLFLWDGIGALLSAFLLGVVLVRYEEVFGIPVSVLYFLAVLPCFFLLYDAFAYFTFDKVHGRMLQGIGIMNLAYCGISLGLAVCHAGEVTSLGWAYIIGEVLLVAAIGTLEIVVARRQKNIA